MNNINCSCSYVTSAILTLNWILNCARWNDKVWILPDYRLLLKKRNKYYSKLLNCKIAKKNFQKISKFQKWMNKIQQNQAIKKWPTCLTSCPDDPIAKRHHSFFSFFWSVELIWCLGLLICSSKLIALWKIFAKRRKWGYYLPNSRADITFWDLVGYWELKSKPFGDLTLSLQ